ncbi:hypothetical protein [Halofilum ochraceum]|uniref:hypothetical protein n=1 Tax=Halofilum ochraceum TaxID=1611323 RepID=UPI0008DA7DDC|nr:hypothetical protein [Halofilum ochraceum]
MRPDPDKERQWQARVAIQLADAPDPDPVRLAAGLAVAQVRAVRRRRVRVGTIIAAVALFAGSAAAAGAWWLGYAGSSYDNTAPTTPDATPPKQRALERRPASSSDNEGAGENGSTKSPSGRRDGANGADARDQDDETPFIYRPAE